MDYEIGKTYWFEGKPYVYLGGSPVERGSWRESVQGGSPTPDRTGTPGGDFLRMAAQGATFGTADELVGMFGGDTQASRERVRQIREKRPVESLVAEAAGGAVIPGIGGASLGGRVAGITGSRILGGVAGGAGAGMVAGGLTGAGEADSGLAGRILGGAAGAGVGAVGGAAFGAAGGAAGRAASRAGVGLGEANDYARSRVVAALQQAGVDPEDLLVHLDEIGVGSVPADLGENLGREARAAVNRAPALSAPGGPVADIRGRHADRGARISGELRAASGIGSTFDDSLRWAEQAREEVSRQVYQPLELRYPVVDGPNVTQALDDPRVQAIARAVGVEEGAAPSFKQLQDMRGHLSDEIRRAVTAEGRVLPYQRGQAIEAARMLDDAIAQDVPEFGPAQQSWLIASKRVEAHELGQKFAFRTPRQIQDQLGQLPIEAREAFRLGLLDAWENSLQMRRAGGTRAAQILDGGRSTQAQLRAILDSDDAFVRLMNGVERESRWTATFQTLRGNSTTVQQQQDVLAQLPRSMSQAVWQGVSSIFGLSDAQRVAAAELIGRTLLSEGPEAARLLTDELRIRHSMGAAFGAATGLTGARETTKKRGGGLLD
jgi:hypothetical protein